MKNRLLAQLPQHKTCLCSIYNPHLYIVDWKDYNKGAVEISGAQRNVINAVHILNENNVKVFFDFCILSIKNGAYHCDTLRMYIMII